MKLASEFLYTNQIKCHGSMQITIEDDINVSDNRPDIDSMIKSQGVLSLTESRAEKDRAILRGSLLFTLLYASSDDIRPVHNMQGQIPFEETMNMEQLLPGDDLFCQYELEDLQIHLINSRKISVRAIVSFHCFMEEDHKNKVGTGIISEEAARAGIEECYSPEGLHQKFSTLVYTQSTARQKDVFRIKDEITLPKGKNDMDTLLYYDLTPQNLQTRLIEDGLRITGDLQVFLLYVPENEDRRMEYLDTELPIDGIVHCSLCEEQMIPDISFSPGTQNLEIKTDEDGLRRLLDLELSIHLNMKFYEDKTLTILEDAYSTACELSLTRQPLSFEKLLLKTQNVVRISDHIKLDAQQDKMLQICCATGKLQIDEQKIVENGIELEGIVTLDILYITDNDDRPIGSIKTILPFSHFLEANGISPEDHYLLYPSINQISVLMLDGEELDAKVVLSLDAMIFSLESMEIITEICETPLNLEELQKMPGIVGFIANSQTTLWDLAKEYRTSPESIMELNDMENETIHPGDRLLLVKEVSGL